MALSARGDVVAAKSKRLSLSAWSWALYQGARDPYIILIATYIFTPYFTQVVIGNAVRGQALVSTLNLVAGLAVALTAPFLGAAVDRLGPRKPWLLFCTAGSVPLICALWFVEPNGTGLSVAAAMAFMAVITVLISYTEVFYNAMLVGAAGAAEQPRASGLSLTLGNVTTIFMFIFVLVAFVLPGRTTLPFIPAHPLFGLSPTLHEPERIVGPIVGIFYALGALPLFLFSGDTTRSAVRFAAAFRDGAGRLVAMFRGLHVPRDIGIYLAARMLYADAKMALIIFGGVYAAGVMQWGVVELVVLGMVTTVAGIWGGVLGGWLDVRIGPKYAIITEIGVSVIGVLAQLGLDRHTIFYFWHAGDIAAWNAPLFKTWPELVYVGVAFVISVVGTASWASSRTLMVRLSPPDEVGTFFGLYALSGTATVWFGPLLIGIFTSIFQTQQAGFAPIVLMLCAGLAMMTLVRGGGKKV
ncbi:MAG: MFS transporter [Rhizomicrobium sp.]